MKENTQKKFLICPLNWGIGHATRCVPIIKYLLKQEQQVIIGGDGRPLQFLKNEFPELDFITIPGFNIRYNPRGQVALNLIKSLPGLLVSFYRENRLLKKIIDERGIDVVISDNRYGLYNKQIKSIFITHQVMIAMPVGFEFFEPLMGSFTRFFIRRYNECWIPDFEEADNLSGVLAQRFKLPNNTKFIGPLSRFTGGELKHSDKEKIDVLALISGPEPQRTIFEQKIINQLVKLGIKASVVLGKTESLKKHNAHQNITLYDHLDTEDLKELLQRAKLIISRSGYSTLMDLYAIGIKAAFVPTPGQTEQEYLAKYHNEKNGFLKASQDQLQISDFLNAKTDLQWKHKPYRNELLNKAIDYLLGYRSDKT